MSKLTSLSTASILSTGSWLDHELRCLELGGSHNRFSDKCFRGFAYPCLYSSLYAMPFYKISCVPVKTYGLISLSWSILLYVGCKNPLYTVIACE